MMRLQGSIGSGDDPSADEMTYGLTALNSLKPSWFGALIGPRLSPQDLTGLASNQAENGGSMPYRPPPSP